MAKVDVSDAKCRTESNLLTRPQHWRHRAEETRMQAEQMADPTARKAMLQIVSLARLQAARRTRGST